jgi:hypothetical protein
MSEIHSKPETAKALVAAWNEVARHHREAMREIDRENLSLDPGEEWHLHQAEAECYEKCASELDAILRASAQGSQEHCIICANGNDLPEGEHCRACGREGRAFGLGAAVIKARGRMEPPTVPVLFASPQPATAQSTISSQKPIYSYSGEPSKSRPPVVTEDDGSGDRLPAGWQPPSVPPHDRAPPQQGQPLTGPAGFTELRKIVSDEWGSHLCYRHPDGLRSCSADGEYAYMAAHCRCGDIAKAILERYDVRAKVASPPSQEASEKGGA